MKDLKIKVIGIGSGGQDAVDYLYLNNKCKNIDFIVINSDERILKEAKTSNKYLLSEGNYSNENESTGCGGNPKIGKQNALIHINQILKLTQNSDIIFLISCFGGGCGTGATPVIAEKLKIAGIKTIAIITKPFKWEGQKRTIQAENGIENLQQFVDKTVVIENQTLCKSVPDDTTTKAAFNYVNQKITEKFYKTINNLAK